MAKQPNPFHLLTLISMQIDELRYSFKRYALHERGMRPKSYRSILATLNMLARWAETQEVEQLSHGIVREFLYWGREERAWEARTFRNHRQYLSSFFSWCVRQGIIKYNPTDGIEKPKLPQRLPRCLTRQQSHVILSQVKWQNWRYQYEGVRNETILYLLIYSGLRLQEMLDLEMSDINLSSGEIFVRQGKGGKDRIVPIHPRLTPVLRNYLAERKIRQNNSQYFITGAQSERPISGKDVRRICKRVSLDSGVYFTPHMLRHTFGRLLIEAGMDVFKIKEMMGHSDIRTTQGYLSVSTENLKRSFSDVSLL